MLNSQELKVDYVLNQLELQDKEKGPKPRNTFQILVLGCSEVKEWGVEPKESWVKKLEKSLNRELKYARFGVANGGIASCGAILNIFFATLAVFIPIGKVIRLLLTSYLRS